MWPIALARREVLPNWHCGLFCKFLKFRFYCICQYFTADYAYAMHNIHNIHNMQHMHIFFKFCRPPCHSAIAGKVWSNFFLPKWTFADLCTRFKINYSLPILSHFSKNTDPIYIDLLFRTNVKRCFYKYKGLFITDVHIFGWFLTTSPPPPTSKTLDRWKIFYIRTLNIQCMTFGMLIGQLKACKEKHKIFFVPTMLAGMDVEKFANWFSIFLA